MALKQLTPADLAAQQRWAHNSAKGAVKKNEFLLPASAAWAVVGTIVADSATVDDVPTLEAAIQGLAEVTTAVPLQWGQAPDEILTADCEVVLVVVADVIQTISFGGGRGQAQRTRLAPALPIKPPLDKKFVVWGLKVPAALDAAGIAALVAAITGAHAGVSSTYHLMDGVTDAELVGNATLTITAHTRIDAIPVEPEE